MGSINWRLDEDSTRLYLKVLKDYQLRLRLGGNNSNPQVASDIKFLETEMVEKGWTLSKGTSPLV